METLETETFVVRPACKDDCKYIMMLIRELGEYTHLSSQIKIGVKELERDGFEGRPLFQCVVAENKNAGEDGDDKLVGYALFYYVYSTFQGRSAYLEDVYIIPKYRCQGLGTMILEKVAQIILEKGCRRLDFVVLEWNNEAAKFYERLGAQDLTVKEQWHVWRLEKNQLQSLAKSRK